MELEKDHILEINGVDSDCVYVVVNGKLVLRDHKLNDPFNYNVMQVAKPGSILGSAELDFGNSGRATVWTIVASHYAHVVKMSRETFQQLFKEY